MPWRIIAILLYGLLVITQLINLIGLGNVTFENQALILFQCIAAGVLSLREHKE